MNPDPAENYADIPVDVMDSEVREAETDIEDSAYVRSYLQASDGTLFGGQTLADELARRRGEGRLSVGDLAAESGVEQRLDEAAAGTHRSEGRFEAVWRGGLIVLQSILAVAFGAGLFVAFDQLWQWNAVVALAAIGAGHPWPGGRSAGCSKNRGHRQHVDRGCGRGTDHLGTVGAFLTSGLGATTSSAPSNQSRPVDGLGVPIAGRGRVRVCGQTRL